MLFLYICLGIAWVSMAIMNFFHIPKMNDRVDYSTRTYLVAHHITVYALIVLLIITIITQIR